MPQVITEQVAAGSGMITQAIPLTNPHLDRDRVNRLVMQDSREEIPMLMIRVQEEDREVGFLKTIEGMISTISKRRSLLVMDPGLIILDQVLPSLHILPNSHNLKNRNSKGEIHQ